MKTGQLVNAQKKVWAFQFDAASPEVNFQDGIYDTQLLAKKNSLGLFGYIKFFQDVSAYPSMTIQILQQGYNFYSQTLPYSNVVNEYNLFVSGQTEINPNNEFLQVQLIGITGSGITSLSFQVCIEITEFDT